MAEQKSEPLANWSLESWRKLEAKQQPSYKDTTTKDAAIAKGESATQPRVRFQLLLSPQGTCV